MTEKVRKHQEVQSPEKENRISMNTKLVLESTKVANYVATEQKLDNIHHSRMI